MTIQALNIISKAVWREIDKQAVQGSKIHLSFQIFPDGSYCIVGDTEIKGKRYGKAFGIPSNYEELGAVGMAKIIKDLVKKATDACKNTLVK